MKPTPRLPYAHLNLRTNPFRTLDAGERSELAVLDVEAPARVIRNRLRGRASPSPHGPGDVSSPSGGARLLLQLLGPGGCGKTTHLEVLRRHFPGARLWAWSAYDGWPPMPGGVLLFVDDAHELARRDWPHVLKGRTVVVAATRRTLTPARDAGVELLTVRVAESVTPDRVRRIVQRRLEWARRGPGPIPSVEDAMLASLEARHGRDLRGLTDSLYRHIQGHPGVGP